MIDARRRRLLAGSAAATAALAAPGWARAATGWPAMSAEDQVPMDPCLAYTPGSNESPWLDPAAEIAPLDRKSVV